MSYRIDLIFRLSVSYRVDMIISYRLSVSFIGIVSHRFDNIVSIICFIFYRYRTVPIRYHRITSIFRLSASYRIDFIISYEPRLCFICRYCIHPTPFSFDIHHLANTPLLFPRKGRPRTFEITSFMSYGTFESCGSRYRKDSSTRSRESLVILVGGFSVRISGGWARN